MSALRNFLHLISDFINAALLLYAILVEREYTLLFLTIIVIMLMTKIAAELID